jgi:GNAT superfamily N-acetyltransferase
MHISIAEYERHQVLRWQDELSQFPLWWHDWEEADIDRCWLAVDESKGSLPIVGFLTRDRDSLCVAIEVLPDYQSQGIGIALCEESATYRPRSNDNPEFWLRVEQEFLMDLMDV